MLLQKKEENFQVFSTKRPCVQDLESILNDPIPALDHGFIRVIDYMGDDSAVVQAARVSYGKGTKKINEDQGLINYLMRHRHTTPFEMLEIKLHVKLPIFVARQWIRHRTANVNEYSARYSILDKEFYLPRPQDLAVQSYTNRQGRAQVLSMEQAEKILTIFKEDAERNYDHYGQMINEGIHGNAFDFEEGQGLARELARMNIPTNFYTQWYWKIDLHNLLHFISLRADAHAQYEIQVYANILRDIVQKWVPQCYYAFEQYRMHASSFSKKECELLATIINESDFVEQPASFSKGEWREFLTKIASLKKDDRL